ncbi:methyl-accepting chemotaxis protein [Hydrogenophaga luteola]|uniref:Methyl-accepting chemotaxis protein n=2 Tax=Hydrogenophaga TaxID=47420 RepID=A0ABV7WAL0_9BURK
MELIIKALRQWRIRTRMIALLVIALTLVCVVAAAGVFSLQQQNQRTDEFINRSLHLSHQLSEINRKVGDINRAEKDMVIYYDDRITLNQHRDRWTAAIAGVQKQLGDLLGSASEKEMPLLNESVSRLEAYEKATKQIVLQVEDGAYDNGTTADKMLGQAKEQMRLMEASLLGLAKVLDEDAAEARTAREQGVQQAMMISLGVLVAVAALLVPFVWLNMRSICTPLDRARELASAIAQGDLTRHVDNHGRDETAAMLASLQSMQASLQAAVKQVRQASDSIDTASAEIASGNQDLSNRTEQAASNLQQTAASMEQLTSTVRNSADAARQANQLAASASEIAVRGGQVVDQVVHTMQEIHQSSQKINDIIGVIDGIAFQTNILALNAAVEAARAGEQGRGFAVVAAEVRNLAQRSAEAAKEIKGLISASVDKVETGSRLVGDAGQTMGEVVGSIRRVTDIVGEISAAAGEQSDGIGQVNVAVTQLDQMTQQNAALVEESAAAAQSLKDQAAVLTRTVQVFRVQ